MVTRSLHVPVIHKPDYTVAYEYTDLTVFGHVEVRRWNHKVAKALLKDIQTAHNLLDMRLFAMEAPDHNPLQKKFLRFCGFDPIGVTVQTIQGETVEVYERVRPW